MKFTVGFLLATSVFVSPVLAEQYRAPSQIDAVTVYPQGADVTRVASVTLTAGEHQLILEKLPGFIDPQSIRVEGQAGGAVQISSVDSKSTPLAEDSDNADRLRLEKAISALADERNGLDQIFADADTQRRLLMSLAERQLVPTTNDQLVKGVDAAALGGLLDVVGQRLSSLATLTQQSRLRQKAIDEEMGKLQVEISLLAPKEGYRTDIVVNLSTVAATDSTFKVSYRIQEAGWQPFYDAKLITPSKSESARLEIVRRALVTQSTAESWNNVALTLSTARPSGTTQAPDINEQQLVINNPADENTRSDSGALNESAEFAQDAAKPAAAPLAKARANVEQRQAVIEMVGFQANYVIEGRVSIDNSGQSKRVRISSEDAKAALSAVTVPRHDLNAYLTATFELGGDAPALPGSVNLYRDGVYVGQGLIPLLNPNEETQLGFGVDDLIRVKRDETNRLKGEEGIISSSNVEQQSWEIAVKNLHDFKIPVMVLDRVPFSTIEDVTVAEMPGMTEPSERDHEKRRGVLAWRFDLDPGSENTIKTGYKVSWPKSINLSQID